MPKRIADITGQKIGRWTVIGLGEPTKYGGTRWNVKCDCGTARAVAQWALTHGQSNSCGCNCMSKTKVLTAEDKRLRKTRAYVSWVAMIKRCQKPTSSHYSYYGGRGIVVCERWQEFNNFFADMGEVPVGRSLERKDVNGNYEPSNCIWASSVEQSRNRRGLKKYLVDDKWCGITELMEHFGISIHHARNKAKELPSKMCGEQ